MAFTTQTLVDSDFEVITKTTITGTNGTATKVVDVSELGGAATDPRVSIVSCWWSVSSQTDILWDATSNVVCFTCNGSGSYGFGDGAPALANNGGSGVTGDIKFTTVGHDSADTYTVILYLRKEY